MRTRDDLGASPSGQPRVEYEDLSLGRIIGAGQFGMVRIAQNKHNGDVYALKVGLLTAQSCSSTPIIPVGSLGCVMLDRGVVCVAVVEHPKAPVSLAETAMHVCTRHAALHGSHLSSKVK